MMCTICMSSKHTASSCGKRSRGEPITVFRTDGMGWIFKPGDIGRAWAEELVALKVVSNSDMKGKKT